MATYSMTPVARTAPAGGIFINGERVLLAGQSRTPMSGNSTNTGITVFGLKPQTFIRGRLKLAAGKWKALGLLFLNWRRNTSVTSRPESWWDLKAFQVQCALELANGVLTPKSWNSPNTGSTVIPVTWAGESLKTIQPDQMVMSDLIYASDHGLPYFEVTDREFQPWIRAALRSVDGQNLQIPVQDSAVNFRYYENSFWLDPADWNAAVSQVVPTGSGRITGLAGCNLPYPVPAILVGIPLEPTSPVAIIGTSIEHNGNDLVDNVSYLNAVGSGGPEGPFVRDEAGWPMRWAERLDTCFPILNQANGASSLFGTWKVGQTYQGSETPADLRDGHLWTLRFADVLVVGHHVNDASSMADSAEFLNLMRRFVNAAKAQNRSLKVVWTKTPLSGMPSSAARLNPALQTVANGNITKCWDAIDAALAEGLIDRILDFRQPDAVGNLGTSTITWRVAPSPVVGTATGGTTTRITDTSKNWRVNEWFESAVVVGGEIRRVVSNTATELNLDSALPAAVSAGTAYEVAGNCTWDGLHPNAFGHRRMAAYARAQLADWMVYRTRVA